MKASTATQVFVYTVLNRYHPVPMDTVSKLLSIASIQDIKKGQQLLQIGMVSNQIHILNEGAVVAYFMNTEGDLYHKNIFLKGDFVGSTVSALTRQPSEFALDVIADGRLISFDYNTYRQLIDTDAILTSFYIAYLEKNWVIDKEKREVDLVLKDAGERYLDLIHAHPQLDQHIPLQYIASHLGITPTQLSRIRKKILKV